MNMEYVNDEVALRASAISMAFSLENPFLLRCALRLKIPDIILKAGPDVSLSVQQIAAQLPSADPDLGALSRILSYLSTMGVLQAVKAEEEGINMEYALTNLSKSYFTSEDINPRSLVPFVLLQTHPTYVTAWANIHERVLHGGDNFKKSGGNGKDFWSFAASNPEFNALFNAAMVAVTKATMADILAIYDGFNDINTLVDVGGGHGAALSLIIDAYPHIRGINFDLPRVIATAPTLPGVQHISGSLFETAAPSADAIFMKNFLHSWNDEDCIKLLNNCYESVPHKGKLILSEAVLDLTEGSDMTGCANVLDAVMLNCLPGGGERTRKQWTELLQAAGFSISKIVGRKGTITKVMEAIKC